MLKIILASASPRRRELLGQVGIPFEVQVSNVAEETAASDPGLMVEELSCRKAEAVMRDLEDIEEDILVIGADTVVAAEGRILGKPSSPESAADMLRGLSGKTHYVYTGVTLLYRKGDCNSGERDGETERETFQEESKSFQEETKTFHEVTGVKVCPMSEEEINSYTATGEGMDKAGAYGVQGIFARYVQGIEGDYNNVVGLPVGRLYQEAKEWIGV